MSEVLDLRKVTLETSSPLRNIIEQDREQVLQVTGHMMDQRQQSGTAAYLDEDHIGLPMVAPPFRRHCHGCSIQENYYRRFTVEPVISQVPYFL